MTFLMDKFLLFFLAAILCSCAENERAPAVDNYVVDEPTEVVQEQNQDSMSLLFNSLSVGFDTTNLYTSLTDSTIVFETDTGLFYVENIVDTINEIGDETYHFIGFNNQNLTFVYHGVFWEEYEAYILNKTTGKLDTLWLDPIFSPNDSLLLSQSMQYGMEYVPNGYQVWRLEDDSWVKIDEINQEKWVPMDMKWVSNTKFIVKCTSVENYLKNHGHDEKYCFYQIIEVK